MSVDAARPIWTEGLFLRPHHFQQFERHFEALIDARLLAVGQAQSGFSRLRVDHAKLLQGVVSITSCNGIFPDGTPFEVPSEACQLLPCSVQAGAHDQLVYLSAVVRVPGSKTTAMKKRDEAARRTRYSAVDARVLDSVTGFDGVAEMKVAALNLLIGTDNSIDGVTTSLPIARIKERRANGTIELDASFIPPLLDMRANERMQGWLDELPGLVKQRADSLAGGISGAATNGVGEIVDFLLLQVCNRFEPLLTQWRQTFPLHPAAVYAQLLMLAGELATFGRESRRPPALPHYDHFAIAACFEPVVEEIRRSLTSVFAQGAIRIPLVTVGSGIYRAVIPDAQLITNGFFVLAATAQAPADRIRTEILNQIKLASVHSLQALVTSNTQGIKLEPLQYPPRQIRFSANFIYFQLEASSPQWQKILVDRVMGLYMTGTLPELELELWGIRT